MPEMVAYVAYRQGTLVLGKCGEQLCIKMTKISVKGIGKSKCPCNISL